MKRNIRTDWEIFYSQDMKQLGNLFNLAYDAGYDMEQFIESFMRCEIRVAMDSWHPALSNGPSNDILEIYIRDFGEPNKSTEYYPENCMKWIGMMYGYLIYYTSMSSKELITEIPFSDMVGLYTVGHEMSFSGFAERLCRLS